MAMNMYSQGVDPQLDFSNMSEIAQVVSEVQSVTDSSTPSLRGRVGIYRFSGSHQDAIKNR